VPFSGPLWRAGQLAPELAASSANDPAVLAYADQAS